MSIPGLEANFSIPALLSLGFQTTYNETYSNSTTAGYLNNTRINCNSTSILCAAGGAKNSDFLEVVACGNCYAIVSRTSLNKPVYIGQAYWYMIPGTSFGFSPTSSINQTTADMYNLQDPLRLSWVLDQGKGGMRLGNKTNLQTDTNYRKYLFIKI